MDGRDGGLDFAGVVEQFGRVMEGAGIAIIVIGAVIATGLFLYQMRRGGPVDDAYTRYRRALGRAILLGLEFLVAGDIIRTVAIEPTFRSLGILAVIVAIRTFLSTELELEIEGRWPWDRRRDADSGAAQRATPADAQPTGPRSGAPGQ